MMFDRIMREKLTLEKVIEVIKLSLFIAWCWPLPKNTIKLKIICATLYQYLTLLLNLGLILGLINTIRNHPNDAVIMIKAIIFIIACTQVVCNIVSYRINSHHLQVINTNILNVNVFDYMKCQGITVNYCTYLFCAHKMYIINSS